MAYMNQEKKARIAAKVKPILKKYGVKGSLSVHHYSKIILTIQSGKIDFFANQVDKDDKKFHKSVNPYWYKDHYDGVAKAFLSEVVPAMYSADYYNNSDVMTDYFDVAYYVSVDIGKWNKPYELVK